jgi:hypothetical protein
VSEAEHCVDDLPGLLHGELRLERLRAVTTHLRGCQECQRELVETAAGVGALARVERQGLLDGSLTTLPPLADVPAEHPTAPAAPTELDATRRRRRTRWLASVAAAVVVLLVITGAVLLTRDGSAPDAPADAVQLLAVGDTPARGEITMSGTGASRTMVVSTDLDPTSAQSYYEVWLLDTRTNGMVAVGVLPTSGTAQFTLPSDLLERYDAVDLSLQPDDGQTTHSSHSVLRAKYS